MKVNQNICIIGERAVLIPYRQRHVPKYHKWMSDPQIRELTASEPLTLEEEYEMQKSWADDEDKLTFIILDRSLVDIGDESTITTLPLIPTEETTMIGDVNIFVQPDYDSEDVNARICEVEVMIAESSARGKGCGREAVIQIMKYAAEALSYEQFSAKIGRSNSTSRRLFEEKLGFRIHSESETFDEVTLRFDAKNLNHLTKYCSISRTCGFTDPE